MRVRVCAPMCRRSRRGFLVKAAASLRVAFGCRSEACDSGSFDCGGLFKGESFDSGVTLLSRDVRLDNDLCGLFACDTGFALVACLIASLRAWDWRRIPG